MSKNWKNFLIICIALNFTYLFSANSDISLHMNKNLSIQQSESLKKVNEMKKMFITNKAKYSETLLDSVVSFGNGEIKIISYEYAENKNFIVETTTTKDETGTTLYYSWKNEKTYNDDGALLERFSKELVDGVWVNYSKEINSYDENGFPTEMLEQGWDSENEVWVNDERIIFSLDGYNITMLNEGWDSDQWVPQVRFHIFSSIELTPEDSDDFDGTDSTFIERWVVDSGSWRNLEKTSNIYDGNNNLIRNVRTWWDNDNSSWLDVNINIYTYDGNNNQLTYQYEVFSGWTSSWFITRGTNTYDASKNLLETIEEEWNSDSSIWDNNRKSIYTYDSNNNMLTYILQLWDTDVEPHQWKYYDRHIYTYNNNNKVLTRVKQNQYWGATEWQNDTRDTYEYASNGYLNHYTNELYQSDGVWVPWSGDIQLELMEYEITYCSELYAYYNDAATSIEEKEIFINNYSVSQNFPNPFNPQTIINYSIPNNDKVKISVYNTLGQKVAVLVNKQQSAGSYFVQFDGSNFASGIYYYQITAGNFHQTKQMLLIK